jgi:hypothetical protein
MKIVSSSQSNSVTLGKVSLAQKSHFSFKQPITVTLNILDKISSFSEYFQQMRCFNIISVMVIELER